MQYSITMGFSGGSDDKVCLQCGRPTFNPWVRKIPWRRKWQPAPVLLPGKLHGQRSLLGYSSWGHKELDTLRDFHFHFTIQEDDLPGGTGGTELACQSRRRKRLGFNLWVRKIWRKAWHPIPVFLPGKLHGQRSLAG